jgi:hypothetical protein
VLLSVQEYSGNLMLKVRLFFGIEWQPAYREQKIGLQQLPKLLTQPAVTLSKSDGERPG